MLGTVDAANDDFIRTTETAPQGARAALLGGRARQRLRLLLDVRGPLLRRLRGVQAPRRPARRRGRVRGPAGLPRPRPPGRAAAGGELVLPAQRLPGPAHRALRGQPRRDPAAQRLQRGACRSSGRASSTSRCRGRASAGASRCPGTTDQVIYVWFDALLNYATAVGYGAEPGLARRRAVRAGVAAGREPRRQGHPALPRRVLARDAHGGRARAAAQGVRARLAARRRREDVEVEAHRHRAGADHRHLRLRRLPLLLPAGDPVRPGRLVLLGGHERALHVRAGQRPRQPRLAGDRDGGALLRRRAAGGARLHRCRARRSSRRSREAVETADAAFVDLDFSTGIVAVKEFVERVNGYVTEQEPWVLAKDEANRGPARRRALHDLRVAARGRRPLQPADAEGDVVAVAAARRRGRARDRSPSSASPTSPAGASCRRAPASPRASRCSRASTRRP